MNAVNFVDNEPTLNTFFQVHNFTDTDSSVFLEMNTSNFHYQDIKKALFNLEQYDENDLTCLSNTVNQEEDEETKNIVHYTRLGAEYLKLNVEKYMELISSKQKIQAEKDKLFKNRNTLIYDLRKLFNEHFVEQVDDLSQQVDIMCKTLGSKYDENLSKIDTDLSNTKKMLHSLGEVYCIFKNTKTYQTCPICYTNEVTLYCNPCGHVFCPSCLKTDYCPICRSRINSRGKLFI